MTEKKILQVDVEEVVKQKSPRLFKKIPGFVFNFIKRTIQQDRINRFLKAYPDVRGVDFAETLLEYLDITLRLDGEKNIPSKASFFLHQITAGRSRRRSTHLGLGPSLQQRYKICRQRPADGDRAFIGQFSPHQ